MKLLAILIGFAVINIIVSTSSSSENGEDLINIMMEILDTKLDDEEIPLDQIPPNNPKTTTMSVTPEMMEIVQKMRDHFGSAWNRNAP